METVLARNWQRIRPGVYLLPGIMVYNSSRNNRRRQAGVAQW